MYFNLLNNLLYLLVKRMDKNKFSLLQQFNLSSWSKNNFVRVVSLREKNISVCIYTHIHILQSIFNKVLRGRYVKNNVFF